MSAGVEEATNGATDPVPPTDDVEEAKDPYLCLMAKLMGTPLSERHVLLINCSGLLIFKNLALVSNIREGVAKAVHDISSSSEAVYETVCNLQYFPDPERPEIFRTDALVNVLHSSSL